MNQKDLKKFLNSQAGQAVKDFLIKSVNKLKDIESIKDLDDPIECAVELKAQRKAVKILRGILKSILTWDLPKAKDERDQFYSF